MPTGGAKNQTTLKFSLTGSQSDDNRSNPWINENDSDAETSNTGNETGNQTKRGRFALEQETTDHPLQVPETRGNIAATNSTSLVILKKSFVFNGKITAQTVKLTLYVN